MVNNKVHIVAGWLRNIANRPNAINTPISPTDIVNIRDGISEIIYTYKDEHALICEHIAKEKEFLFVNQMAGYVQFTTINPFGYTLDIDAKQYSNSEFRDAVNEKLKTDLDNIASYIEKKINKSGLTGYSFYFYILPFNNAQEDRATIINKLKGE